VSMTPRERFLCALSGGKPDVVPFAEQYVAGNVPARLLGLPDGARYEVKDLAERLDHDIVKFSHLPPMYYERISRPGGASGIGPGLIRTRDDLDQVDIPMGEEWIDDAREFLRTQRGDRAAVGGTRLGISPVLVSMGLEPFSIALYEDRALIEELIDRFVAFSERTVQIFGELGFDAIWCFDDFAYHTGPMFSPDVFNELFVPRIKRATQKIELPWIFCGMGRPR